jgi:hypothetical protein
MGDVENPLKKPKSYIMELGIVRQSQEPEACPNIKITQETSLLII